MSKYHSNADIGTISDVLKNKKAKIHFVGVGGVGMYPLFRLTAALGYSVSGSDAEYSRFLKNAHDDGLAVYKSHSEENVIGANLVVYSLAISEDNPEILFAEKNEVPCISRAEYFGYLMLKYKTRIGVSGSHGKSTVTAMLDAILKETCASHTTVIGAKLPDTSAPYRIGSGQTLVFEACEYKDSFLYLNPTISVFTNLELDHVDYFKNLDQIKKSFLKAMERAEVSIVNADDVNLMEIAQQAGGRVVTFGRSAGADCRVLIANVKNAKYKLKFTYNKKRLFEITLAVPGEHNVLNACAACAAAVVLGIDTDAIKRALCAFCGIERRLEVIGSYKGATVYYDYAHHPTEIECSVKTVREMTKGKITVIFKPHTYSRTAGFMREFADALSLADKVLLTEISAIREDKIFGVTSEILASYIGECAEFIDEENIVKKLKDMENGAIIVMGAANLDSVKEKIIKEGE